MLIPSRLCLAFAGAILSFSAMAASGEPFTLVQGKNGAISTYGSGSDNDELDRLKRTSNGPFLWFRDHGKSYVIEDRTLLARADAEVLAGGPIAVDGQKTDGIDPALKDLRARAPMGEVLAKAHGRLACFAAGAGLSDWAAAPREIEGGFITRPGVFSADGIDAGSALLAAHLPDRLGPKVADLGAGWGYLARQVLARQGVKRIDLVEAEAEHCH